jgi:signal transduction histidine kinase
MSETQTRAREMTEAAAQVASDPAFAALQAAGAPVLAASGDPPRVVYMNDAAKAVFECDVEALNEILFRADEPGARRLTELARSGRHGAAPRLERICFPFEVEAQNVTVLCRNTTAEGDNPSYFIMATLGVRPSPEDGGESKEPHRRLASRFLWRTDADGKFVEVTDVLVNVAGAANADILGRDAYEVAQTLGLDPEGRLAAALAQRQSWSGIEVQWPLAAGGRAPTTLGGLPIFDEERRFAGFRGYGLMRLDQTLTQEEAARPAAPVAFGNELDQAAPTVSGYANVVPLRPLGGAMRNADTPKAGDALRSVAEQRRETRDNVEEALTPKEQDAFAEIARALAAAGETSITSASADELPDAPNGAMEEDEIGARQSEPQGALARYAPKLLDQLPIGVIVARGDTALYANRTLLNLLGYADLAALEADCGLSRLFGGLALAGSTAKALPGAYELLTQDGEKLGVNALLQTMEWDGGPAGLITVQPANTQASASGADAAASQARLEAERANAAKSDFLARVSHEIRTPLSAILGFAEVMMEERFGPVGNERYKQYLNDIHVSGEHVLSLVNDLLDLSKIEAGKLELEFERVDVNAVVGECVSIMHAQASRARVVMRLSLAPRLPRIRADRRSLKQILLNLLSNAVKFNQPGGQVIVSSALTDTGFVMLRIKDTGVGMSNEEIETALEPFRQLAPTREVSGTGLGLPVTKALIEANHASFTIKSRKNEGTLVEIAFAPPQVLAAE